MRGLVVGTVRDAALGASNEGVPSPLPFALCLTDADGSALGSGGVWITAVPRGICTVRCMPSPFASITVAPADRA